jgi:hypothetical protein
MRHSFPVILVLLALATPAGARPVLGGGIGDIVKIGEQQDVQDVMDILEDQREGAPSEVAVGPDGLEGPDDPYFLKVGVTSAETPHESTTPTDDCAHGARPYSPFQLWVPSPPTVGVDPSTTPPTVILPGESFAWLVPTCVATLDTCAGPQAAPVPCVPYASYNVTSGRYYAEVPADGIFPVLVVSHGSRASVGGQEETGTTGFILSGDCLGCPPPSCCPI